jgi:hypothetical protein
MSRHNQLSSRFAGLPKKGSRQTEGLCARKFRRCDPERPMVSA